MTHNYFKVANFVKPTGDGLLMTFSYSEDNLLKVSEEVINSCLACLNDFPTICSNDPMINFPVPQAIGFGLARGTACCLYSGKDILDYSGHLLNLASRLNDLARPSGIVVDGNYLQSVIPESSREMFKEQQVYVRSIAEEVPMKILYLDSYVQIPDSSLTPLVGETWRTVIRTFTVGQFAKLASGWREHLPTQIKSIDKVKVTIMYPKRGTRLKGLMTFMDLTDFIYIEEGAVPTLRLDIEKAQKRIAAESLSRQAKITFRIEYVPKALPRT